ncbi:MAG: threonine/serine exporter family protein [Oscillospiraceae bacterium]|nr:threonine/serine exporter family protein [Oscillospiraceae bacterium]MBP1556921.1 threonine/serine exporter family protein [Oscillospiraceae bacterium]
MIFILSAAAAAFGFGIFFNLRGKKLLAASIGGAIGWLVYMLFAPLGEFMQYFAASIAITVYSEIMARVQKAPAAIYLAPALIPLVPGGTIYETMLYALKELNTLFLSTGIRALTITGALTLGIVTTASVARVITMLRSRRI